MQSDHARERARWKLSGLKMIDELRTGEALEFTYFEHTFHAFVTRDALIGCDELEHGRRASARRNATTLVYHRPTNFVLDCIDEYRGDATSNSSNPNGWDHVRRVRGALTLNEIRDRLVRDAVYRPPASADDESSLAVDDSLDSANPSELASRILNSPLVSVERIKGSKAYKHVAQTLEQCNWQLLHIVDAYEVLIERLLEPTLRRETLASAHRVLVERRRRIAASDVGEPDAPDTPERPTVALAALDVVDLLNSLLDERRRPEGASCATDRRTARP